MSVPDAAVEAAHKDTREVQREDMRAALEAAAPHILAAAVESVRAQQDHIEPGAGAYSTGFHYALDCVWLAEDE